MMSFHERLWEAVASGRLHCQNSASGDKTCSNMTGMLLPTKEHVLYCERNFFAIADSLVIPMERFLAMFLLISSNKITAGLY